MPNRGRTVTHSAKTSGSGVSAATVAVEAPRTATPVSVARRRVPHPGPKLKVGYVADRFPCASHGFVLQEILALQALGIDVEVFSLNTPDGRLDDTAMALGRLDRPVHYFAHAPHSGVADASGLKSRQALWVASQIAARRIAHLHAHSATGPTDVAREAGQLAGIGYSFPAYADGLYDGADLPLLRRKIADGRFVVTLTDVNRGRLLRICGADVAGKLHRIPMGIDPSARRFCHPDAHDTSSVLAFGPLVRESGFADLVEAIAILRDRGRTIRLTIVGQGAFEPALRAQIDGLGLTDRVLVLATAQTELITLMNAHTAMVLPWVTDDADRDVLASVVLDAMATGIVVLSTDFAPIRELIDDGVTGRVIDSCDPAWLAGALEGVFDSPDLRGRMAVQARTMVERQFTASRNVSRLARLFVKSAAGNRPQ